MIRNKVHSYIKNTPQRQYSLIKLFRIKPSQGDSVIEHDVFESASVVEATCQIWNIYRLRFKGIDKGWNWQKNKRPKGPHIVHLSTMCHLFEGSARTAIFVYWSARKTQSWSVEDVRIWFSVRFHWIPFSGFRGKVENVSISIGPKTQNWQRTLRPYYLSS